MRDTVGKRRGRSIILELRVSRCGPIGSGTSASYTERPAMSQFVQPSDLELAALISSKICHDVINPVGAIYNGLEILSEEDDADAKSYALDVIRNVTEQASARLQFARFAFGASGGVGALIDLATAEQISRGFVGQGKHKLVWQTPSGYLSKDKVKLLLNLVAAGIAALPRGGEIAVIMKAPLEQSPFEVRCKGTGARPPQHLIDFLGQGPKPELNSMTIQFYYTTRLAECASMRLDVAKDGLDVVLRAR
jgi:histidine phosphotransferase ChpT